MLAVVTCLRSKSVSSDWDHHVWLLRRTVISLLNQRHRDIAIYIAHHEKPDFPEIGDPRVVSVPVHFESPARVNDEMCADKVLKLTAGIDRALQHGAEYVMFADGDDLASNRIASLVSTQRGGPGWYNVGEYYHRYGSNWLWKRTIPPAHSSPTVIMRADLLEFASPYDRAGYWHQIVSTADNTSYIAALQKRSDRINTLAAVGHNNYPSLASHHGIPLLPLPFPASMVILHADSTSNVEGGEGSRLSADFARKPTWRKRLALSKRVLLHLAEFRPVNRRLRDEFAVPTYDQVPGEYRGTGVPLP